MIFGKGKVLAKSACFNGTLPLAIWMEVVTCSVQARCVCGLSTWPRTSSVKKTVYIHGGRSRISVTYLCIRILRRHQETGQQKTYILLNLIFSSLGTIAAKLTAVNFQGCLRIDVQRFIPADFLDCTA
jgi:hypothetical protein